MTTAFDRLVQEQDRIGQEAGRLNNELPELTAKEQDLQVKLDRAIMEGKNTIRLESLLDETRIEKRRIEHQLRVLNKAHENGHFEKLAREAMDELAVDLSVLNDRWHHAVKGLDAAFEAYVKAAAVFRDLDLLDTRLQQRRTFCQGILPKGAIMFVQGVPERCNTDRFKGPIFMCADQSAKDRIKQAYMEHK